MRRVALLGMPNTGKSTFFNRLTGAFARVGNWPGLTVEVLSARVPLGNDVTEVVDLPGIYDLHGFSDDERVVRHFLAHQPVDLLVLIANAAQIERQLGLVLQVRELRQPAVLLLNMADEARKAGVEIDLEGLSRRLGMPVVMLCAKSGQGVGEASRLLARQLRLASPADPARLERLLGPDEALEGELDSVLRATVRTPARLPERLTTRLDRVVLHRGFGLPLFLLAMFLLFQLVFALGEPLQEGFAFLLDHLRQQVIAPAAQVLPPFLQSFLVEGVYDGVSTVAAFVPLVMVFFVLLAFVEDSGYLSRAAFVMDALMTRLGLDGRSFVMLLMGFGCNVPALLGTRVMRSRGLRLLTMLVIPFSLCSARLQVFVFLTAAVFTARQAPLVLFGLYLMSFATAAMVAFVARRSFDTSDPFVQEMPPYRLPALRTLLGRAWHEVRHFLTRATGFIVAGVVMVWLLTRLPFGAAVAGPETPAGALARLCAPLLEPLGIPPELAVVLIFGFAAKEIVIGSLAVVYGAQGEPLGLLLGQALAPAQAVSFMLFTLLYTPCLSAIATLRQESQSWRYTGGAVLLSLTVAWLASFAFYQAATWLGF